MSQESEFNRALLKRATEESGACSDLIRMSSFHTVEHPDGSATMTVEMPNWVVRMVTKFDKHRARAEESVSPGTAAGMPEVQGQAKKEAAFEAPDLDHEKLAFIDKAAVAIYGVFLRVLAADHDRETAKEAYDCADELWEARKAFIASGRARL